MSVLEPQSMPLSPPLNGTHDMPSHSLEPPPSAGVNGTANGTATPAPAFDLGAMRAYLLAVLPAMFGASPEELENSLNGEDFEERMLRFTSEAGGPLYVVKAKEDGEGESPPLQLSIF